MPPTTIFLTGSFIGWILNITPLKDHKHFSVSKAKVSRVDSKTVFHLLLWSLHSHTQKNLQLSPTLALCLPIVQKIYVMYLMNFLEHAKCPNVPFMIKVTLVMELHTKYLVVRLFQLQTCSVVLCCILEDPVQHNSMLQESRREGWTDARSAVGFCLGSGLFGSYNSD